MRWSEALISSIRKEKKEQVFQAKKPVPKTCSEETQTQGEKEQVTGGTDQKQHVRENKCGAQKANSEQDKARASHEAWRITLRPVPKHVCRKLPPEEEKHLQAFIKTKLEVAPRRGDAFYHMSGSDLWWLQGEYEKATGYKFSMWIDYFDWYVAQATGAQVMKSPDGQVWLVGVSYS